MRVHILGARGSTPAPGQQFSRYGGHTSCLAIAHDGAGPTLVLDAGTGIRSLTRLMGGAAFNGSVLLGHLHWDHTQGLPFFSAGDDPRSRVVSIHVPFSAMRSRLSGEQLIWPDLKRPVGVSRHTTTWSPSMSCTSPHWPWSSPLPMRATSRSVLTLAAPTGAPGRGGADRCRWLRGRLGMAIVCRLGPMGYGPDGANGSQGPAAKSWRSTPSKFWWWLAAVCR